MSSDFDVSLFNHLSLLCVFNNLHNHLSLLCVFDLQLELVVLYRNRSICSIGAYNVHLHLFCQRFAKDFHTEKWPCFRPSARGGPEQDPEEKHVFIYLFCSILVAHVYINVK